MSGIGWHSSHEMQSRLDTVRGRALIQVEHRVLENALDCLKQLVEECDHEVGICWCGWRNAIYDLEIALGKRKRECHDCSRDSELTENLSAQPLCFMARRDGTRA